MEWVETTGRTVEEAKKAALEQLGVEEAEADFEVISEPKLGLFGRLREEARVRARVQPRYPRSKVDRRDRRRSRASTHSETQGGDPPSAERARSGASAKHTVSTPSDEPEGAESPRTGPAPSGTTGARRRRRTPVGGAPQSATPEVSANFGEVSAEALEEQTQAAEQFLRGLLTEMGATATVSSHQIADGLVQVEVEGDGLGTLIGPKGATLAALQELTRTAVQRQSPAEGRIVLDVNGYRKRRQDALARFTQQVAEEVRTSGVKRALEPMPPPDRKVVHDAVNSIIGVRTISEGEEPYRRVVLIPDTEAQPGEAEDVVETAAS